MLPLLDIDVLIFLKIWLTLILNLFRLIGMNIDEAAKRLAELGHSTRLEIFRYLIKAGPGGAPVGKILERLNINGSTLSHHLSRLVRVGLVKQERESRILYCIAQYEALAELMEFLNEECCQLSECCNGTEGYKDDKE